MNFNSSAESAVLTSLSKSMKMILVKVVHWENTQVLNKDLLVMDFWNSLLKILMSKNLSKYLLHLDMTSLDSQQNQETLSFQFIQALQSAVNSEMHLRTNTNTLLLILFKMQSIEQRDKTREITSRMRKTMLCLLTDILIARQPLSQSLTKLHSHCK